MTNKTQQPQPKKQDKKPVSEKQKKEDIEKGFILSTN